MLLIIVSDNAFDAAPLISVDMNKNRSTSILSAELRTDNTLVNEQLYNANS